MNDNKYYAVPYISNSSLTWFKVSPKYCWKRMNRQLADEEYSYTTLGKQLHMSLLEPEEFAKNYTYLDFKTPASKQQQSFCEEYVRCITFGKMSDEEALKYAYSCAYLSEKLTEAAILKSAEKLYESNSDYIQYLQVKGDYREILSKSKKELITTITNTIKSHKKASVLMTNEYYNVLNISEPEKECLSEVPIYWDYPIVYNGEYLKCKSLIDRLVVDHAHKRVTIVDLKTTSILGDFTKTIIERDYYRQLAFYRLSLQHSNTVPNDYEIDAYIVAVNTQDPYECRVYKLSDAEYQAQVIAINKIMMEISWHWFTGQWEYSRTYYEGDGTENLIDENSYQSIERNQSNRGDTLCIADVLLV